MAHLISGKQFEEIKAFYLEVDINRDGEISEKELVDAAIAKIENCTENDITMIKKMCDLDGSGTISFVEFLEMMAQFQYNKKRSACGMKCLFKAFDTDGNGVLSKEELKRAWMMFMNKDEEVAEKSITNLMEKYDKDGDGKISYDEFVRGLFKIKKGKRKGRIPRKNTKKVEDGKKKRVQRRMLKNAKKENPEIDEKPKEEENTDIPNEGSTVDESTEVE